jgi:hypothetical protein
MGSDRQLNAAFIQCPDCGASLSPHDDNCWLCRLKFKQPAAVSVVPPARVAPATSAPAARVAPVLPAKVEPVPPVRVAPAAPAQTAPAPPAQVARAPRAAGSPLQFSIGSILLVTTLIAVCFGVFRLSLVLGIFVVALATPALVRTVVVTSAEKRQGRRPTMGDKFDTFIASVGVIVLAGLAGMAACVAACLPSAAIVAAPHHPYITAPLMLVAFLFSGGVGIWVAARVIRSYTPRRP